MEQKSDPIHKIISTLSVSTTHPCKNSMSITKATYSAASDLELGGRGTLLDLDGGGIRSVKVFYHRFPSVPIHK